MTSWSSGQRVIVRGERWTVLEATRFADCETLRLSRFGVASTTADVRTFVVPFDRPRRPDANGTVRVVRPRAALHHIRRAAVHAHPFGGLRAAASHAIDLLPYQLEPALAALRHGWPRLLIADDVGLGKTIEAGLIVSELRARSDSARVLILTPAGLRAQWARELACHFDIVSTVADAAWLARVITELPADVNPWMLPGVYVASLDFVKRAEVLRPLEDLTWDALVVDEAHGVTLGTDRRAAVDALASRARIVVLLSATPHDSDPDQRDALCRIGAVAKDSPLIVFRRTRSIVHSGEGRRSTIMPVRPSDAERRMHRLLEAYTDRVWREATRRGDANARLVCIILRKRALSSAASLAMSLRRRMDLLTGTDSTAVAQLPLPLGDDEPLADDDPLETLATPGMSNATRERRWLAVVLEAALHAARHETKLLRVLRLITKIKEPLIVFTEYRDTLARLRDGLAARGIRATLLHGGMTVAERDEAQHAFNTRGGLLLATDAAAEGLNLHARCRAIVHYELPWNPSRLEQRAGRVDRFGQQRRVHEIGLVAADTAERLVLEPIARRVARARRSAATGRLVHLFAESRVALAIMEQHAVPIPEASEDDELAVRDAHRQIPAIADEAVTEAARLSDCRRRPARSPATDHLRCERPVATILRGRPTTRAALVSAVVVRSEEGRVEDETLTALCLSIHPMSCPGTARRTREHAERVCAELRSRFAEPLRLISQAHLARTQTARRAALERVSDRERELAVVTESAARRLVQAGLFERPAPRQCASTAGRQTHAPSPQLSVAADLVAVVFLPPPR